MRVLAISFMLPPMLYPQAIQIGRLLEGCDVDLATVSGCFASGPSGPKGRDFSGRQRFIHRIELPHRARLQGLTHRLAMRLAPFYGRSPDEFVNWAGQAAAAAGDWLASGNAVDVMATFGEPMSDHLVGLSLKRRFGLPWLAHFSDPWVDNPFRRFQPLANLRNRRLEAEVVEAADSVVFTSEETRQLVMRKYPAAWRDKAFVLPHSFDPADFQTNASERTDPAIVLRYVGNFYGHRTPFPLFSSLLRLAESQPEVLAGVRVELIGATPRWMRWHPALKRLPQGLLRFCDPVPYQRSLELMSSADLLLVIDVPAKTSVFLPSKLVDYIGAGTPIFGIVPPGASHQLIARFGGATADPQAPANIDAELQAAIGAARAARQSAAPWGAAAVREQFEISRVADSFRKMLAWTHRQVRA